MADEKAAPRAKAPEVQAESESDSEEFNHGEYAMSDIAPQPVAVPSLDDMAMVANRQEDPGKAILELRSGEKTLADFAPESDEE